jgi:phenylalanyl-tRNA synthetase alpha subunit
LGDNVGAFFNGCGKLKKENDRLRSERDASRVRHKSDKGHWKEEKAQMEQNWKAEKEKMEKNWNDQKETTERDLKDAKTELQAERDERARDANDIRKQMQEKADRDASDAEQKVRAEQGHVLQSAVDSHGREIGDNYEFKPTKAYLTL